LGQSIGQGLNSFFSNLTSNFSQAGQQFANNLTRSVEAVGNGSSTNQQQLTPPNGAASRTAAGALAALSAGAVCLLML
jgi:hypothetical protein